MAFTGTATIEKVSDRMVRVTGLSLAGAAAGVIGLAGSGAEIELPADPTDGWKPYGNVSLIAAISTLINIVEDVTTPVPISIVKTGSTNDTFAMTFHNDTAATASGGLEIYIEFH